jgi:PAT family beta-lactamase induction signal transducer AmpG
MGEVFTFARWIHSMTLLSQQRRRLLGIFILGISSGLPLALTGGTLQAWLTTAGISVKTLGLSGLVGLPYSLKFLWAPLIDRYQVPWIGRRRGWICCTQIGLAVSILLLGAQDPTQGIERILGLAVIIAFLSATQDIVIDSLRTESLHQAEYGNGATLSILGYRVGMMLSSAVALMLSDHMSWFATYGAMSLCIISTITALPLLPESSAPAISGAPSRSPFLAPLHEFFSRGDSQWILAFVFLYKLGDVLAVSLLTNFVLSLGFTRTDIGAIGKGFGLAASIIGGFYGGAVVNRKGIRTALIIAGWLQSLAILLFAWLAQAGHSYPVLVIAIVGENFCNGLGNAALVAGLMALCHKQFTATQYALLSSLSAIGRTLFASGTGYIVEAVGWTPFFILCWFCSFPGMALCYLRTGAWFPLNQDKVRAPDSVVS